MQEAPRTFRSLLEGDDLREGLGQPLVSPYTLRTLKPYPLFFFFSFVLLCSIFLHFPSSPYVHTLMPVTLYCYIWRDYTSKPRHLRLMEELMAHPRVVRARRACQESNKESGDPYMAGEDAAEFPIDYVYFRPWLLPQVNTFLCSCISRHSVYTFFLSYSFFFFFSFFSHDSVYLFDPVRFLARNRCTGVLGVSRLHCVRSVPQHAGGLWFHDS